MELNTDRADMARFLERWRDRLRLRDWDIRLETVGRPWRKSGDIKIDQEGRNAVLLINVCDPKQTNLEELIIHELLHLKLYAMDQMIEELIGCVYGADEADARRGFAYTQFMLALESTVHDLSKGFLACAGEDKAVSFGRVNRQVDEEIGEAVAP